MAILELQLQIAAIVFVVFVGIIALFTRWSDNYTRKRQTIKQMTAKKKIFACGEDISPYKLDIPQQSFYWVFIKYFRLYKLKEWHSGDLSRYLMWIFTGMVLIMLYMLLLQWL